VKVHTYPLTNLSFGADSYSCAVAKRTRDYVTEEGVSHADTAEWFNGFGRFNAGGRDYFCSGRLTFLARKPE
jgi:hypothetical protein